MRDVKQLRHRATVLWGFALCEFLEAVTGQDYAKAADLGVRMYVEQRDLWVDACPLLRAMRGKRGE